MRNFNIQHIPKPEWAGPLPTDFSFLDVEIGCGVGFHPIDYSKKNSNRLLIAIEKTSEKFEKFQRRFINHHSPRNLVPVHANAVSWVAHYLAPETVDRYFILYPNPYPKDPQKRFFKMPFMRYLIHTLKPQGQITFATNIQDVYEEALNLGENYWNLKVVENKILDCNSQPRSHFEKKYLLRKENCFHLVFEK